MSAPIKSIQMSAYMNVRLYECLPRQNTANFSWYSLNFLQTLLMITIWIGLPHRPRDYDLVKFFTAYPNTES
jgi:hypothetical protein